MGVGMKFEQKTKQFIEKWNMLPEKAGVLVGLSGGADSVALLEVLCRLRRQLGLRLFAVHVHHGIRTAAQRDADFCARLCEDKEVPFVCERVDVPRLAEEQGLSLEEAGRKARYEIFERYRAEQGLDVIAVAHHQNDQAETMLFQMFRGSGLRGLAGIPCKRDFIIRPLLCVSRKEIEAYLEECGLSYVTDETNLTQDYTRNRLRHQVLPMAEEICPGTIENMSRTSAILREMEEFMEQLSRSYMKEYSREMPDALLVYTNLLEKYHPALQKAIILYAIESVIKSRKDITQKHVEGVLSLLEKGGEKVIDLPQGYKVMKSYDTLGFYRESDKTEEEFVPLGIEPGETYTLPDGKTMEVTLLSDNNFENIPKSNCIKWFDYDKIIDTLYLRTREKGDFLTVRDDGATKTLQDYFVNEKVPKSERDRMLVLADGSHIIWVLGKRISAHYKVTEKTKHILQIHIGGNDDGRENRSIN